MSSTVLPPARIEAWIAPDAFAVVRRAAELEGRSVSEFVASAAQEAAHRAIVDRPVIRLSLTDQRALAATIVDPGPPNRALVRAARTHRRLVQDWP